MAVDPGDLSNLRDLAIPDPAPFWPLAPGVWIILATAFGMLAVAAVRMIVRRRADAYRRAAAAELDAIEEELAGRNYARRDPALCVFELLKRTALAAYPRTATASLTGVDWADFLARTSARPLDVGSLRRAAAGAYGRRAVDKATLQTLVVQARIWIAAHRAPAEGDG